MRIVVDEIAVLKGARFGFIRIHREIVRALLFLGNEGPLLPGTEPRPAATAQAGVGGDLDDLLGFHVQRFFERLIAAGGYVVVVPVDLALGGIEGNAFGEDGFGESH